MGPEGSTGAGRADGRAAPESCESCGAVEEDLVFVRRVYVTPESWDTAEKITEAELEWWCFVCRTHYPHQEPT